MRPIDRGDESAPQIYGLVVAVCLLASAAAGQTVQVGITELAGTTWRAEQIGKRPIGGEILSSLEFGVANRVSGKAGCNRFTGAFELDGKRIDFGQIASTRMMCPPPAMEQEEAFFRALAVVKSFELTAGGKLLLFDAAAAPVLRFTPL